MSQARTSSDKPIPVCLLWVLKPSPRGLSQHPIGSCLHSPSAGPHPTANTQSLIRFSSALESSLPRLSHGNLSNHLLATPGQRRHLIPPFLSVPCHHFPHFSWSPFTGDGPFLCPFTSCHFQCNWKFCSPFCHRVPHPISAFPFPVWLSRGTPD